jgi:hypothetical protein
LCLEFEILQEGVRAEVKASLAERESKAEHIDVWLVDCEIDLRACVVARRLRRDEILSW